MKEINSEYATWLTWQNAKPEIAKINPELSEIIDTLDPDDSYKMLKVRYPYGSFLLQEGRFILPTIKGEYLPFDDPKHDELVQKEFSYLNTIPLGVLLNRSAEIYLRANHQITPFSLIRRGYIISIWNLLEPQDSCDRGNLWNIVAGGRSVFMLPKVTDNLSHKRLQKEYGINVSAPKRMDQHWDVFKALAEKSTSPWHIEVLYFGKKWLENRTDNKWKLFRYFLMQTAWKRTTYLRNQYFHDYVFSCMQVSKGMKPNPYLADMVKHVLAIAAGYLPGFGVAIDDDMGPIRFFQQAYIDTYQLKSYAPLIIQPRVFNRDKPDRPVYCALAFPTLLDFAPTSRKLASKLDDLRGVKHILKVMMRFVAENPYELNDQEISVYTLLKQLQYAFFHGEPDPFGDILPAGEIPNVDVRFASELSRYRNLSFCDSSPFLKGCIQVSTKKDSKG